MVELRADNNSRGSDILCYMMLQHRLVRTREVIKLHIAEPHQMSIPYA